MLYMYDTNIPTESINIFDGGPSGNPYTFGNHILRKWYDLCESDGRTTAAATLWPELDSETQSKIVCLAIEEFGSECDLK